MMDKEFSCRVKKLTLLRAILNIFLVSAFLLLIHGNASVYGQSQPAAKNIIVMIADGWGAKQIEAASKYTGTTPSYQSDPQWVKYFMSTFPAGCSYDTAQAWTNFNYALTCMTDSAAAATAMYSGQKTQVRRISVSADGADRLFTIGEKAKTFVKAVGAISTVELSDATPGAWMGHNDDRGNYYAIADEGFFGDPNTTGLPSDPKYAGGHGPTFPTADVVIGDGRVDYVNSNIRDKLRNESGQTGKHFLVERQSGQDGGNNLIAASNDPDVIKLAGLFDQVYRLADGSGYNPENPTLAESATSALNVLNKYQNGFVLMIEGGAVDWSGHANNMDFLVGEMLDFNQAVQTVIDWIENPANGAGWDDTLLIVTGDHECGYLTAAPGVFPDEPLGEVTVATLPLEKIVSGSGGRRASWNDINSDSIIDSGETVYWAWNDGGHSNSLIPFFARGAGSELFTGYATGNDTVRGAYIDNTDIFKVINSSLQACSQTGYILINPGQTLISNPIDLTSIVTTSNATNLVYTVTEAGSACDVEPNGTYIEAENYTGTITQGTATFSVGTSQGGYLGTGYLNSNGGGIGYCPSVYEGKEYLVNFPADPEATTYEVWVRGYATGGTNDSIFIGFDGNCAGALREQAFNQWKWTNTVYIDGGVNTITVPAGGGLHKINVWIREPNHKLDGIYIVKQSIGTPPTDVSHGLEIDPTNCDATLFTGNNTQAQTVDTTGWPDGVKDLIVTGDNAICLTPLTPASDTFTFNSGSSGGDTLSVANNTAIASGNPADGDPGVVMQRFQVDSNTAGDGQVELVSLDLVDTGTATSILDAKIYISTTSSTTLPESAVLIGNTGVWNGSNVTVSLNNGTAADRTVINGTSKYIYIVYDLSTGQVGNTIQSHVTGVSVAAPDSGAGDVGTSNLLTLQACVQTGSISILPGQTLYSNPIDLTSIITASNASNLVYTVTGSACDVEPNGTYIEAENYTGTITQGTATFSVGTSQGGYLGTGYLNSNGGGVGYCPSVYEGKEYLVNFPADPEATTYEVWVRGYATGGTDDSIFIGFDGNCAGALREQAFNQWKWTNTVYIDGGVNTITVPAGGGLHKINVWIREPNHKLDGIYIVKQSIGTPPTDVSHGLEIDPTNCDATLFTGNNTQAQTVDTTGWPDGVKDLIVTGDDDVCLTPLTPASDTFTYTTITMREWTGGGADNLASNPANWSSSIVPQNGDSVLFDGTSATNCDWNINVPIASLNLNPGYTGVFTLNTDLSITDSLIISDGTFMTDTWNLTVGQ